MGPTISSVPSTNNNSTNNNSANNNYTNNNSANNNSTNNNSANDNIALTYYYDVANAQMEMSTKIKQKNLEIEQMEMSIEYLKMKQMIIEYLKRDLPQSIKCRINYCHNNLIISEYRINLHIQICTSWDRFYKLFEEEFFQNL